MMEKALIGLVACASERHTPQRISKKCWTVNALYSCRYDRYPAAEPTVEPQSNGEVSEEGESVGGASRRGASRKGGGGDSSSP